MQPKRKLCLYHALSNILKINGVLGWDKGEYSEHPICKQNFLKQTPCVKGSHSKQEHYDIFNMYWHLQ